MIAGRFSVGILLLAASVAGVAPRCRAQSGEAVDGRIVGVTCRSAHLTRNGKTSDLTQINVRMGLKAGDLIECRGTGSVDLLLPTGQLSVTSSKNNPFPIPSFPDDPQYPKLAEYLRNYGVAGATRGNAAASRVLWPVESSVILPEHFSVRWAPVSQKVSVSILTEAKDITIWGPAEMDGNSGLLQSKAMSSALAAYKAKAANPALVLTVTFGEASDWDEVHFSLLTVRLQQELDSQLDFWARNTDGLAQRLGRAYSFQRYKLFSEAADEYEAALDSAPESPYLLTDALQADRLAGRAARVKELQSRLASSQAAAGTP